MGVIVLMLVGILFCFLGYKYFRTVLFLGFGTVACYASFLLTEPLVSVFARPFVFMLITMIVLPRILGMNGIWLATPAAELMVFSLSAVTFLKYRKRYGY